MCRKCDEIDDSREKDGNVCCKRVNMEYVELAEQFELVDSIFPDFYQGLRFGSY